MTKEEAVKQAKENLGDEITIVDDVELSKEVEAKETAEEEKKEETAPVEEEKKEEPAVEVPEAPVEMPAPEEAAPVEEQPHIDIPAFEVPQAPAVEATPSIGAIAGQGFAQPAIADLPAQASTFDNVVDGVEYEKVEQTVTTPEENDALKAAFVDAVTRAYDIGPHRVIDRLVAHSKETDELLGDIITYGLNGRNLKRAEDLRAQYRGLKEVKQEDKPMANVYADDLNNSGMNIPRIQ